MTSKYGSWNTGFRCGRQHFRQLNIRIRVYNRNLIIRVIVEYIFLMSCKSSCETFVPLLMRCNHVVMIAYVVSEN